MDGLVSKLAHILFYPFTPSPDFLSSLMKYTVPTPAAHTPVEVLLHDRSPKALAIYSRLVISSPVRSLVYVFLVLSTDRKDVLESVRVQLKRSALGFSVPLLNPTEMVLIKSRVEFHKYNLIHKIYTNCLVYKKLRSSSESPKNNTHRYFLESVRPLLHKYEETVLSADYDILLFHNATYGISQQLHYISHLNDIVIDRLYLKNERSYDETDPSMPPECLSSFRSVLFRFVNECTKEYFATGTVNDPNNEYFIKDHAVLHDLVPSCIGITNAEKIAYIGKYVCFLSSIECWNPTPEMRHTIDSLDFSVNSYTNRLDEILQSLNELLYTHFIGKYRIVPLLEYIHDVFLFGRHDFIDHFFLSLKEVRKTSRKNLLSLLEDSLQTTFPGSPFNHIVDLFTKQPDGADAGKPSSLAEGFGLFCHLEYPVSILLDEKFILKLVYIFKFLWKLKKVDMLCRRIGDIVYLNLVHKILFYVFNEVIHEFMSIRWEGTQLSMDALRKGINIKLDIIMKRLFINTPEKKIEYLLYHMEKAMVAARSNGELADSEIQQALKEFYLYAKPDLEGTALHDICNFIKIP